MIECDVIEVDREKIDSVNKELFRQYRKNPNNLEVVEKIIRCNIPMVFYVINVFGITRGDSFYDDFVSEGLIAINDAIVKHKYRKGKFSTYAFVLIKYKFMGLMSKRNVVRIPENKIQTLRQLEKDIISGKKVELSKDEEDILKLRLRYVRESDFEEDYPNKEIFFDIDKHKDAIFSENEMRHTKDWNEILEKILCNLPEREQNIIRIYFSVDGGEELRSAAKKMGISVQRVRQIKERALKKIRIMLVNKNMAEINAKRVCTDMGFEINEYSLKPTA